MKMSHQMIPNPKMLAQEYEPIKRKRGAIAPRLPYPQLY